MNNIKLSLSISIASIAAIGVLPYGYRFAYSIFSFSDPYITILGYIFAISAMVANIALGAYSLISIELRDIFEQKVYIVLLSILGAIPLGFINFLGYLNSLPIYINIVLSIVIAFVNAGIGFRALLNALDTLKNIPKGLEKNFIEIILRTFGFLAGAAVSSVGYVAATSSLFMLFNYYQINITLSIAISYIIAFFTWLPSSALFANSTQIVLGEIYEFSISKSMKTNSNNKVIFIFIVVVSLLSASALTQMVIELFKPENNIPEIFKNSYVQSFIYKILAPIAFLSSTAVNIFALKKLRNYLIDRS